MESKWPDWPQRGNALYLSAAESSFLAAGTATALLLAALERLWFSKRGVAMHHARTLGSFPALVSVVQAIHAAECGTNSRRCRGAYAASVPA